MYIPSLPEYIIEEMTNMVSPGYWRRSVGMCTFMSFFDVILGEIIHWSQQFVIGSLESMVRAASPESRLDMAVVYARYHSS